MAVAMVTAVTFVYPALEPSKSGRELARIVRDETAASRAAGRPVLSLDISNVPKSVNFYSDGVYLKELEDPSEVAENLDGGGETYLLASEASMEKLPQDLRQRMTPVYSIRLSGKNVVLMRIAAAGAAGSETSTESP